MRVFTTLIFVLLLAPQPGHCFFGKIIGFFTSVFGGSNVGKNVGESAAREVSASISHTSDRLSEAVKHGFTEARVAVETLSDTVSDLAKDVSIRLDSGDLANIGVEATQNIKEALTELSNNWELALNTAHLQDFGVEASKHLSEALQNINATLEVGPRLANALIYISIAIGIAFSVFFVAMVVCCRRCFGSNMNCCNLNCSCCSPQYSPAAGDEEKGEDEMELQNYSNLRKERNLARENIPLNNLTKGNSKVSKKLINTDRSVNNRTRNSLKDYTGYSAMRNYWVQKELTDLDEV